MLLKHWQCSFSAVRSPVSQGPEGFQAQREVLGFTTHHSPPYIMNIAEPRKTRPRMTCLYSAESMLPRRLSAMLQIFDSKPRFAAVVLSFVFRRAMMPPLASVIKAAAPYFPILA